MDALRRVALEALVNDSADLEAQLRDDLQGARPLIWVVKAAKDRAATAVVAFTDADPTNADAIRGLQNEIKIFRAIVELVSRVAQKGVEAEQLLNAEDRDDIVEILREAIGPLPQSGVESAPEEPSEYR